MSATKVGEIGCQAQTGTFVRVDTELAKSTLSCKTTAIKAVLTTEHAGGQGSALCRPRCHASGYATKITSLAVPPVLGIRTRTFNRMRSRLYERWYPLAGLQGHPDNIKVTLDYGGPREPS